MSSDTRREIEQRAKHPGEFGLWVEAMIADGDKRLPEVARWATERGDVELLMTLMDDYAANSEMRTVEAIREALPTLGDEITARVRSMLHSASAEERRAGAMFAGALGLHALADRLVDALTDGYFLTRMEAARSLGLLRYGRAVPGLRRALADEDSLTRRAAIEALTLIPDPDLKTAYIGSCDKDPPRAEMGALDDADPRVRDSAIRLLRRARPPCTREVLAFYIEQAELFAAEAQEGESTPEDLEVVKLAREVLAEVASGWPADKHSG